MRKGEIWDVATGEDDARTRRILIVSADEWHAAASPQAVAVVRRHGIEEILPFAIRLHDEADSVGGIAYLTTLMPVMVEDFRRRIGSVSGVTLSKVDQSLRAVYAL